MSPQACHSFCWPVTCMLFKMWIYCIFHDFRWRKSFSRFWTLSLTIYSQPFILFSTLFTKDGDGRSIFFHGFKTDRPMDVSGDSVDSTHQGQTSSFWATSKWLTKGANKHDPRVGGVLLWRVLTWNNPTRLTSNCIIICKKVQLGGQEDVIREGLQTSIKMLQESSCIVGLWSLMSLLCHQKSSKLC